jgi:hypothetical protein
MKLYIGIDPGKTGGWAVTNGTGEHVLSRAFEKSSYKDFMEETDLLRTDNEVVLVALEQVQAMPGQGVSSMFTFGANYGGWLATLQLLNLRHVLVRPQAWQKAILGAIPKGESKPRALLYAQRMFPGLRLLKKDSGIVDALLISYWARQQL